MATDATDAPLLFVSYLFYRARQVTQESVARWPATCGCRRRKKGPLDVHSDWEVDWDSRGSYSLIVHDFSLSLSLSSSCSHKHTLSLSAFLSELFARPFLIIVHWFRSYASLPSLHACVTLERARFICLPSVICESEPYMHRADIRVDLSPLEVPHMLSLPFPL